MGIFLAIILSILILRYPVGVSQGLRAFISDTDKLEVQLVAACG